MRNLETLQRVTNELKLKGVSKSDLSEMLDMNYNYLTRLISGNTKYSSDVYDKIMQIARNKGINTTIIQTRQQPQVDAPLIQSIHQAVEGLNAIVTLQVKIENSQIKGVEWELTKTP